VKCLIALKRKGSPLVQNLAIAEEAKSALNEVDKSAKNNTFAKTGLRKIDSILKQRFYRTLSAYDSCSESLKVQDFLEMNAKTEQH
jgi:hypothetical protein